MHHSYDSICCVAGNLTSSYECSRFTVPITCACKYSCMLYEICLSHTASRVKGRRAFNSCINTAGTTCNCSSIPQTPKLIIMGVLRLIEKAATFLYVFFLKLFQADAETVQDPTAKGHPLQSHKVEEFHGAYACAGGQERPSIALCHGFVGRFQTWAEGLASSPAGDTIFTRSQPLFLMLRRATVASCLLITVVMVS